MQRLHTLSGLWQPFIRNHPTLYAAGASFYILLSVFPALVFLLNLLSHFPVVLEASMELLEYLIPASFLPLLEYINHTLAGGTSVALLSLSAIAVLWSASKGIMALMDGLNAVLGVEDRRGFLRRRILSVFYFLLLAASLIATLCIHALGQWILGVILRHFPLISSVWQHLLQLRFLYTLLPLALLFALLYRVLPATKIYVRHCLLGGGLSAAGWLLFSALFSVYVTLFASRQFIYNGIGFLILTLLWLHICILLFLLGGIFSVLLSQGAYHPIQILKSCLPRRRS